MVTIYIKMYNLARYHARKIEETQSGTMRKPENKALFTLGMIMGLFLVSWIPFFIINLVNSACKCVPDKLFVAVTWVGYVNSTMNPIIYSKFNADFRAAFKRILLCKKCRRPPDPYERKPRSRISNNIKLKKLSKNGKSVLNGTNGIQPITIRSNGSIDKLEIKNETQSLLENGSNRRQQNGVKEDH